MHQRAGFANALLSSVLRRTSRRQSWPTSPDSRLNELVIEATTYFLSGNFSSAATRMRLAAEYQSKCRSDSALDMLNLRLCGRELLKPIGHMAVSLDLRAKRRALKLYDENPVLLISGDEANSAYGEYWARYFPKVSTSPNLRRLLEQSFWQIVEHVSWIDCSDGTVRHLHEAIAETEHMWQSQNRDPLLAVSSDDRERGLKLLASHGVGPDDWFVALHLRESSQGSRYGRNSSPDIYTKAINRIRELGGHVVAVGQRGSPAERIEGVISLTRKKPKDPWVDIYLLGCARFVIGAQSGPASVAATFGTPVLMTGVVGWGFLPFTNSVMALPKSVVEVGSDSRPLRLAEMAERDLLTIDSYLNESRGIRHVWVDASTEVLEEAVAEMLSGNPFCRPATQSEKNADSLHHSVVGYRGLPLASVILEQQ